MRTNLLRRRWEIVKHNLLTLVELSWFRVSLRWAPVNADVTASASCTKVSPAVEADAGFLLFTFLSMKGGMWGGVSMLSCIYPLSWKIANIHTIYSQSTKERICTSYAWMILQLFVTIYSLLHLRFIVSAQRKYSAFEYLSPCLFINCLCTPSTLDGSRSSSPWCCESSKCH